MPFLRLLPTVLCNLSVSHATPSVIAHQENSMPSMQTVNRIIATSTHPVYVIDWNRSSEHGSPESLPHPIKEWLETKYPEVEVGRLDYPQAPEAQPSIRSNREEQLTASVFIIGFNAEQADAFIADLSCSQSRSRLPKSPDFYLIRCAPKHLGALIHWHALLVRQRLLGQLRNLMRATTYEPTNHSKENHHDSTRLH